MDLMKRWSGIAARGLLGDSSASEGTTLQVLEVLEREVVTGVCLHWGEG